MNKSLEILPWNDSFFVGIPEIDAQHKMLVQLLNRLASGLVSKADKLDLNNIFNELLAYVTYHFQTEEQVWHQFLAGDPWEAIHQSAHQSFLSEVFQLKNEEKPLEEALEGVLLFLTHWLAHHILESDRRMALLALAVQSGMPIEQARLKAHQEMSSAAGKLIETVLSMYDPVASSTLQLMKEIAERRKTEQKANVLIRRNQLLMQSTPEGIHILDAQGRILEANEAFCRHLGYTPDEVLKLSVFDFEAKIPADALQMNIKKLLDHPARFESVHKRKDGTLVDVEIIASGFNLEGVKCLFALSRDITEHRTSEIRIERLTKLYKALSEVNQAIVRMDDESGLFPLVCRIAVELGGMGIAWIGKPDEISGLIEPVASHGNVAYLDGIVISAKEDVPEGRGPAGTAFREGRNVIVNDFLASEMTNPWHERALPFNWRSGGFFPIFRAGAVFALFAVYHTAPDVFDAEMIGLLNEVSNDISFALDNFDRENERRQSREAFLAGERRFRAYFERSMLGMAVTSPEKGWLDVNEALCAMLGYSREELMRMTWSELTHADDLAENLKQHGRMMSGDINGFMLENRFVRKDGQVIHVRRMPQAVRKADGSIDYIVALVDDITERKKTEDMLSRLGRVLDESPNEIFMFDANTLRFILVNAGAQRNLGYSMDELARLTPLDIKPRLTHDMFEQLIAPLRRGELDNVVFEAEHQRKDKSIYPVEIRLHLSIREISPVFVAIIQDITERKRAELELRIAATAFETQEGILIASRDRRILRVNSAFTRLTGYSAHEAIGQTPAMLKSGRQDAAFYHGMWKTINREKYWQGEIWNQRKDGVIFPEWLTITAVSDINGEVTHYIGVFSDITLRKAADEQIHRLAFFDTLTGLPNRSLLRDRLQLALNQSARHKSYGAILFIDLDNFKMLNDTRGHDIGDMLLIAVARRLQDCIRSGDTVARLGGDEFVIMLEALGEDATLAAAAVQEVGEKVLAAISHPFSLRAFQYHSSSSIGISLFHDDKISIDDVLKHADTAMYQAKASGRNAFRFFDPVMQNELEIRAALEADLRQGLRKGEFRLYYQAQVDSSGRVTGAEALVRWQHPLRGMVSPMLFIPLSEETGLILPLGHWVLETACVQLAAWGSQAETAHLTLSVNVSARQFRHTDFVAQVMAVLDATSANPQRLKLELTESLLVDNVEETIAKMAALKTRGVSFSLDDFGTGYSSLSYLKRLPLDQLKIDQSFVRDILTDTNDAAIARTIIALAQQLDLSVIAEGVETEAQREFLARHGCLAYQGYLFGRPVPIEALHLHAALKTGC